MPKHIYVDEYAFVVTDNGTTRLDLGCSQITGQNGEVLRPANHQVTVYMPFELAERLYESIASVTKRNKSRILKPQSN